MSRQANKRKKIALIAIIVFIVFAGAIALTIVLLNNRRISVNINTNVDSIDQYSVEVKNGLTIADIRPQQINGYTFVGFYKDEEFTEPYAGTDPIKKDMTIYARYDINSYTLSFPTSNAFTIVDVNGDAIAGNQVTLEYGTEFKFKVNMQAGYTDSDITVNVNNAPIELGEDGYYTVTILDNTTIQISGVEINSYTVNYYDEEGNRLLHREEVAYNEATVYAVIPEKQADNTYTYTFAGWVDEEGEAVDLTHVVTDMNVYASFTPVYIEYTITKPDNVQILYNNEYLTTDDTLHYGDIVEITYQETIGHEMTRFKVQNAESIGGIGNLFRVTGNVIVIYEEELIQLTLTFPSSSSYIIVDSTDMPIENNQVTIAYGTEFKFKVNLQEGYTESNITVNANNTPIQLGEDGYYTVTVLKNTVIEILNVELNSYTVTYYDEDGEDVLYSEDVEHNESAVYAVTPTKPADNTYTYTFAGWVDEEGEPAVLTNIVADMNVYASFTPVYIEYTITKPDNVTIAFNEDDLTTDDTLHYGDIVEITYQETTGYEMSRFEVQNAELVGDSGNQYRVTGNIVVIYEEELIQLTISFSSSSAYTIVDGTDAPIEGDQVTVDYGIEYKFKVNLQEGYTESVITVNVDGEPISLGSDGYYTVTVYENTIVEILGIEINGYAVNFYNEDGSRLLHTEDVEHNESAVYAVTPTKPADNTYTYTFAGWVDEEGEPAVLTNIVADMNVYASFTPVYIEYTITKPDNVTIAFNEDDLTTDDTLHYGDIVEITYQETTGYEMSRFEVQNAELVGDSGNQYRVTGNIVVIYEEELIQLTISFSSSSAYTIVDGTDAPIEGDQVTVDYGTEYKFKVNLQAGYTQSVITVRADSETLQLGTDGYYSVTVLDDISIEITGIELNSYTVRYYAENRTDVLYTEDVEHNESAVYAVTPTKPADNTYTYTFADWVDEEGEAVDLTHVVADMNVYASFTPVYIEYTITKPDNVTITYNEEALTTDDTLHYGDIVEIIYLVSDGYGVSRFEVQNAELVEGNQYRVTGNVVVIYEEAKLLPFTIVDGVITAYTGSDSVVEVPSTYSINENLEAIEGDDYTITGIGDNAFQNCTTLTSVKLPASVTSIGDFAFMYCTRLTNIQIPSSVTRIGYRVFWDCTSLTSIEIPAGVTSIDYYAFENCTALEMVTFAEGSQLATIGQGAFEDCTSLTSIEIPATVTSIGDMVFSGCSKLSSVTFAADSQLTTIGQYVFRDCTSLTSIVLPASITSLGYSAFSGCSNIEISFVSGSQKTSITGGFISGASNVSLDLTSCTQITSIGTNAFQDCTALSSIILPATVMSLADSAFSGCNDITISFAPGSQLTSVNGDFISGASNVSLDLTNCTLITSIEINAFYNCTSLTSIEIPVGVMSIGMQAFSGCSALETVIFAEGSKLTIIDFSAFMDCSSLANIEIPAGVTSIGMQAFLDCTSLTSIEIPAKVTYIGGSAFSSCSNLESVIFAEGSQIEIVEKAFALSDNINYNEDNGVQYLGSVSNPYLVLVDSIGFRGDTYIVKDSCRIIAGSAFYNCTRLTGIEIPATVISIGSFAFDGRSDLITITFAENSQLKSIGDSAFQSCSSLTSIEIPAGVTSIEHYTFNGCSDLANVTFAEDSQLTTIGDHAFRNCTSLTSIEIPASVTSIGDGAFEGCSNIMISFAPGSQMTSITGDFISGASNVSLDLTNCTQITSIDDNAFQDCTALTSIILPATVTRIGLYAFDGCSALINAEIPMGVTSIRNNAFSGCTSLTSINIPASVTSIQYNAFDGCSALETVIFAEGSQLTHINNRAFQNCTSLTSIKIPASVTSIGSNAFNSCSSLETVTFAEGSQLTGSLDYTFRYCTSLTSINIPDGVTSIGFYAFQDCSALTSVVIPAGVTSIELCAFDGCSALINVEIPMGVTSIGNSAFNGCSALTSIEIPASVTTMDGAVFANCTSLTSIEIPASVTSIGTSMFSDCSNLETVTFAEDSQLTGSIGYNSFYNCTSLTSINIPAGVTSIGLQAFDGCSALKTVTFAENSQLATIGYGAFRDCTSLTNIEIPASVTSIEEQAFYVCTSLNSVTINSSEIYAAGNSGYLLYYAKEVRVLTSCMNGATNSYLDSNFTQTAIDGEYTVFTRK